MLQWFRRRAEARRRAQELYGSVVTAARQPSFYKDMGVPDTPEGRFEMVSLHLFLALESLNRQRAAELDLTQRTIEAFVTDMDDCMRATDISMSREKNSLSPSMRPSSRLSRASSFPLMQASHAAFSESMTVSDISSAAECQHKTVRNIRRLETYRRRVKTLKIFKQTRMPVVHLAYQSVDHPLQQGRGDGPQCYAGKGEGKGALDIGRVKSV